MRFTFNKTVILLISLFLVSIYGAAATVSVSSVTITPANPITTQTLDCGFKVVGDQSSYIVNITWTVNGTAHIADDQTGTSVGNNTQVSTSSLGDIETSDTHRGDQWICQVTATDGTNVATASSSTATIANSDPIITSTGVTTAKVDVAYSYTVTASDGDGDSLNYALTGTVPTGMSISSSGVISWTPSQNQTGTHTINVEVTDNFGGIKTQSYSLKVVNNKLFLNRLSAKCDPKCDDDDLDEDQAISTGDAGTITDVRPGAKITFSFEAENGWPSSADDHDIENIELECTIEDIGDDDEETESIDFGDLDPGDNSDKEKMEFIVSKEAEDGKNYKIECTLTGEDQDGNDYDIDFDIKFDVDKEKHSVIFDKNSISPSTISCNRNFAVTYKVKNVGSKDEDDVQVTVKNAPLSIMESEFINELQEGDFDDDDTEKSSTYSYSIGKTIPAGTYQFRFEVFYNDGDDSNIEYADLIVSDCIQTTQPTPTTTTPTTPITTPSTGSQVEVVTQPVMQPTQKPTPSQVVAKPTTTVTGPTEDTVPFTDSVWFIVLLAVGMVVLLGIAIWMITLLAKK